MSNTPFIESISSNPVEQAIARNEKTGCTRPSKT